MKKNIEIYVVSGFLGSGKTTFLSRFLQAFEDKKVGVLVNELGTVNIDGVLIERQGIQMTEITNGSIYCYCKQGDFIQVLRTFSTSDIDILLIENSGMADPSNIHGLLKQGEVSEGREYDYKGAICILDAMTFLNHVEVLPSIGNQVRCSNVIVLNKVDMVEQVQLEKCKAKVLELNEQVHMIETMYAEVDMNELSAKLVDNGYDGETTNKCYNKFMSYSIECEEVLDETAVLEFVESIKSQLYRMKGFVKTEESWLHIESVGDYVISKEVEPSKKQKLTHTKLVVIGKNGEAFKDWLLEMWNKHIDKMLVIYE